MAKRIIGFTPLFPPHVGGLENHAQQLNEQFAGRGHAVTVWASKIPKTGVFEEYSPDGVHILRYPAFEVISNYPVPNILHPQFWRQFRIIWGGQWDVVISHTRFFLASFLALVFARTRHLSLVHIEHGSDYVHLHNPVLHMSARLYDYTLGKIVLRRAHRVVAVSRAVAVFVARHSERSANAVIYRGVDLEAINAIKPATRPTIPTITYVGRLIDGKGVHDLLTALAQIKVPAWQAWIIGDGPQRHALHRQAAALGIKENVHFLGMLPWDAGIARMKASTVFVNPSYTEGLPTAVIEAAATGICVLATDVGGTAEIISQKHGGHRLIPPGDVPALTRALQTLVVQKRSVPTSPPDHMLRKFRWAAAMDAYEKIFAGL